MLMPVRLVHGWLPQAIETRVQRFVWADPRVLLDPNAASDAFRTAMNAIYVGGTFKITRANRHPIADELLIDNVDLRQANIVDMGASDGSTSLDLIGKLAEFGSYTMADLFLSIEARTVNDSVFFYDRDGTCILAVGRRLIAWPSMSRLVHLLYRGRFSAARRRGESREVLLLNPDVRQLMDSDGRISARVHDVFQPWEGPKPDVIKVANLLRRLYFSDAEITRALSALHQSLAPGGHLLVVDNSREKGMGPRGGLYRRENDHFTMVRQTPDVPEIADLVLALGRPDQTGSPEGALSPPGNARAI